MFIFIRTFCSHTAIIFQVSFYFITASLLLLKILKKGFQIFCKPLQLIKT